MTTAHRASSASSASSALPASPVLPASPTPSASRLAPGATAGTAPGAPSRRVRPSLGRQPRGGGPGAPLRCARPSRRALLAGGAATAVGVALAACGSKGSGGSGPAGGGTVTVVTHDSFSVPDELIDAFRADTGYALELVASGKSGELTNKLVLTKDAPLGDAFVGVDNTFASRILDEGVIDASAAVDLPEGADRYIIDDTPALTPIDFGEVCINIDTAWFAEHDVTPPAAFEDLTGADYKDLFVAINPSTSSTGLAFLLATVGHFGTGEAGGFADYWKRLAANGMRIDEGWSDAYYTDFSGGGEGGAHPIVVSYSSSPAATLTENGSASTTAALLSTATRQVEYAGVLAGAANPDGARAFLTWMLSADVQSSIPETMYMYPVNPEATLSEELRRFGATSDDPVVVPADDIAAHREAWLATWTEAVGA